MGNNFPEKEDGHSGLTDEENLLLRLLGLVFSDAGYYENTPDMAEPCKEVYESLKQSAKEIIRNHSTANLGILADKAKKHGVLSLLYDIFDCDANIPEPVMNLIETVSSNTIRQSYRLMFISRRIVRLLENEHIGCAILKGSGTAELYPVPELRKSGDIDLLLLDRDDIRSTEDVLKRAGFRKDETQDANHHISYRTDDNIEIEIHIAMTEAYDNMRMNSFQEKLYRQCKNHVKETEALGSALPVLDDAYHAYYLLLHMLQHFLRSGFGLKLLCDWVAFWRKDVGTDDAGLFLKLIRESRLENFTMTITAACIGYLEMDAARMEFLYGRILSETEARDMGKMMIVEVMDADEFGNSSADRMVMLRGSGIGGYIREFHHQMTLNFPMASKIFIIWPLLWAVTYVRFIYNNKKIRGIKSREVMKSAKERSRFMKELEIFRH